jgi:hypothetical protein
MPARRVSIEQFRAPEHPVMKSLSLNTVILLSLVVGFAAQLAYQLSIPPDLRGNVYPAVVGREWFTWVIAGLAIVICAVLLLSLRRAPQDGADRM